jgi:hypothetical protein
VAASTPRQPASPGDRKRALADEPFSFRDTKGGQVFLYYRGRHVETLKGHRADLLLAALRSADPTQAQLLMAKATKNFKRGNEKHPGTRQNR